VNLIATTIVKQSPNITPQLAHAMVYGRLKKRFHARSYIEIRNERRQALTPLPVLTLSLAQRW